jgi:hypothetical protein
VTAAESWGTPEPYWGKSKKLNSALIKLLGRGQTRFFADSERIASSNGGICDNIKLLISNKSLWVIRLNRTIFGS